MDTELVRIFVKIIENGSFSKAAETLNVPKSTISKAIAKLEQETSTKVLLRTTRSLTLTAAGKALFDSTFEAVHKIEDAYKALQGQDTLLSGTVRITAPEDIGSKIVAPAIGKLTLENSKLAFDLQYTDKKLDLIKDGFDIAIRVGTLEESGFKIKKVGEITMIVVASPQYIKSNKRIKRPEDLLDHNCFTYGSLSFRSKWALQSKDEKVNVKVNASVITNHMSSLLQMSLDGSGVSFVPDFICKDLVKSKQLINILPGWKSTGFPVSMILPLGTHSSARLKITSQLLSKELERALATQSI